jgi:hypothetical protein
MARYIQAVEYKAYVPVDSINRVMAACIENNVSEFVVGDDRGGSGHWMVTFQHTVPRKLIRTVVGPHIHVEKV